MLQSATSMQLATHLREWLTVPAPQDSLGECGPAVLKILQYRPDEALELAKSELQNRPYREVPACWLRLYEESSLYCAAELLSGHGNARVKGKPSADSSEDAWLSKLVGILDYALIVSGAPRRRDLFEKIFTDLSRHNNLVSGSDMPPEFDVWIPEPLQSMRQVPAADSPPLEAFQMHLDNKTTPLLLTGVIDDWPAMQSWKLPSHLLRLTLNGCRLVPIEIGETYTSEDWRQEIIPFRRYLQDYLLPETPTEIGYLGQHNIFAQIPQLIREIRTPDYCFSAPPEYIPESRTGLPPVEPVDAPQMNVWLGPKGTRTPLHTDPYHNIFCQVVGYKYVRLYPPGASASLYPRGVDENGINESNTSQVEIRFNRESDNNVGTDMPDVFPRFLDDTSYLERIVGPGESLYIPAGWWHYIESLTTSFSVSFWWN